MFKLILLAFLTLQSAKCDRSYQYKCRDVTPMVDFEMQKVRLFHSFHDLLHTDKKIQLIFNIVFGCLVSSAT